MKKYSVKAIDNTGRPASFFASGIKRDGWIMPDGRGVWYAGYAQITFEESEISNITYYKPPCDEQPTTFTFTASGPDSAAKVILELVNRSAWFEFTPMPDDLYEIRVKEENAEFVRQTILKEKTGQKQFTVLLLYPDYLAENYGEETYHATVWANSSPEAVALAQAEAAKANNEDSESDVDPNDFRALLCIAGDHQPLSVEDFSRKTKGAA